MKPYFGHFRPPGPPKTPLNPPVPVNSKCFTAMDQLVPVRFEQDMISCGVAFESLSWGELNATIFWEFGCPWYPKKPKNPPRPNFFMFKYHVGYHSKAYH